MRRYAVVPTLILPFWPRPPSRPPPFWRKANSSRRSCRSNRRRPRRSSRTRRSPPSRRWLTTTRPSSPSASNWPMSRRKKDRAALAKLVVAQGFFWIQDKDVADPKKPGVDESRQGDRSCRQGRLRLVDARRLWQRANRGRIARSQGRVLRAGRSDHRSAGVRKRSAKQTQTDPVRMGLSAQGRRRSARRRPAEFAGRRKARAQPGARAARYRAAERSLTRRLSCTWRRRPANPASSPMDAIAPLGGDQMCYIKDASGWKITGFLGGAASQTIHRAQRPHTRARHKAP